MWGYRNLLFLLFTALAAPIEFHIRWLLEMKKDKPLAVAINEPLVSGALFFYSIIVIVEALIRLETHPAGLKRPATRALKIVCILFLLPFAIFLTNADSPLSGLWISWQWTIAILSFCLSVIVHAYISRVELLLKAATP